MTGDKYEMMLREGGVKPTANRMLILKTLSEARRPLSMAEIEAVVMTIDKSSISRTLGLFREHHLVHIIEVGESLRYELCHSHDHAEHDDMHVHFYCEHCGRTFCIDCAVPPVQLPDGFTQHSVNYTVRGVCDGCQKRK